MQTKNILIAVVALIVVLFITVQLAREYGYQEGFSTAEQKCLSGQLSESQAALKSFSDAAERAAQRADAASQQLSQQLAARQTQDEQTTRNIKNALKKTAATRVNCVYDADSMRELIAARERATAAAASGISHTLSAAAAP